MVQESDLAVDSALECHKDTTQGSKMTPSSIMPFKNILQGTKIPKKAT